MKFGIHLSPGILLLVFVYANLLNYVDRGLVAGVLPTYCVACTKLENRTGCSSHHSCEWNPGVMNPLRKRDSPKESNLVWHD